MKLFGNINAIFFDNFNDFSRTTEIDFIFFTYLIFFIIF